LANPLIKESRLNVISPDVFRSNYVAELDSSCGLRVLEMFSKPEHYPMLVETLGEAFAVAARAHAQAPTGRIEERADMRVPLRTRHGHGSVLADALSPSPCCASGCDVRVAAVAR
jgi:hypothetical protein